MTIPTDPTDGSTTTVAALSAPVICARRGTQWMTSEDVHAHLAALARLENIAVLLGSGASAGPVGGMTLQHLWQHFCRTFPASLQWLIEHAFLEAQHPTPNVEMLADTLDVALAEWTRQSRPRKVRKLNQVRHDLQRALIHGALLDEDWWRDPRSTEIAPRLAPHRALLQKLTGARQPGQPSPWIFTTNYDLAVEWAGESIGLKVTNGFDGVHNRTFAPHNFDLGFRNTLARGEARFGTYNVYLAKLHGSLTWRATEDNASYLELPAVHLWSSIDEFLAGGHAGAFSSPVVFPSAAKYIHTVGFVLGELLRRFTDVLARPQTCLITSGYSFADEHINRIIATALQNPTLQLVLYLPEAQRAGDTLDLSQCQPWVKRIGALSSPQVTIVGGDEDAHFGKLVQHLPDPAIHDEQATVIRDFLRQYAELRHSADGSMRDGRAR